MMMDELAINVIRGLDPRIDPLGRQDVDDERRRVDAREVLSNRKTALLFEKRSKNVRTPSR